MLLLPLAAAAQSPFPETITIQPPSPSNRSAVTLTHHRVNCFVDEGVTVTGNVVEVRKRSGAVCTGLSFLTATSYALGTLAPGTYTVRSIETSKATPTVMLEQTFVVSAMAGEMPSLDAHGTAALATALILAAAIALRGMP